MTNTQTIVVRDNKARMRAASYLSFLGIIGFGLVFTLPLLLVYGTEIPVTAAVVMTLAIEASLVIASLWYAGQLRNYRRILGLENFRWKTMLLAPAVAAFFFGGLLLIELILKFAGIKAEDSDTSTMFANLEGLEKYLMLFAFVSFIVPVMEEIFFRGYVLNFLIQGHDLEGKSMMTPMVLWSMSYTSLLFAILHFQGLSSATDFIVLLWTFLFSFVTCIIRLKAKSLYPTMGAHSLYNLGSAIALALA